MPRIRLAVLCSLSVAAAALATAMWAATPQQIEQAAERARDLRAEAETLERAGHLDEAHELREKADRLLEEVGLIEEVGEEVHPEGDGERHEDDEQPRRRELRALHEQLELLHREAREAERRGDDPGELSEKMEAVEREIAQLEGELGGGVPHHFREQMERIERLHHIARQLDDEDLDQAADAARRRAEHIERDLQQDIERHEMRRHFGHALEELHSGMHQLREEVRQLHAEVRELHGRLERGE